jgi:hypothetical protein
MTPLLNMHEGGKQYSKLSRCPDFKLNTYTVCIPVENGSRPLYMVICMKVSIQAVAILSLISGIV